jgi:hypothetical protein
MSDIGTELRERSLRAEQDGEPIPLLDEAADEIERLRERVASLETCERHLQSQLRWLRLELVPVYNRTYNPNAATVWPRNLQEFVHTGVMPTHCMRDSGD